MEYKSKYPEIIIDKNNNTPNDQIVRLTVEQYYDLLHHTHKLSDLVPGSGSSGEGTGSGTGSGSGDISIGDIDVQFEEIVNTGNATETVEKLVSAVNTLQQVIVQQHAVIVTQENTIKSLDEEVKTVVESSDVLVEDWDVTKPGIQDIDGNTIDASDVDGLEMVEI